MKNSNPQDQVFWYLDQKLCEPFRKAPLKVDVVVVGGGMAGISAAQAFRQRGLSVALLEKNFCGAGASGKSSGFITPDSEFSLHNLINFYGNKQGENLWNFAVSGVDSIRNNIKKYNLNCDYQEQDTLVVATTEHAFKQQIIAEHEARTKLNFGSKLYQQKDLTKVIGSSDYFGGVRYPDTFGIRAYHYCQEMKNVLLQSGVSVFEETEVTNIAHNGVETPFGFVTADLIVVCIDQFITQLKKLMNEIYHVQTFLMMSSPLRPEQIQALFPDKPCMVWDTSLIYNYFRLAQDNRLMLGGAQLSSTYARQEEHHNQAIVKKLTSYFNNKFPQVDVTFDYIWPGLIGITKDIIPLAGRDEHQSNLYYITGAAGLPWAAALGVYSAESCIDKRDDLDEVFSPYRSFALGSTIQKILGTRLTFALSNFMRTRSL